MKVYCPYCEKEVEYKIEKRELKEFRGIEVNTFENVAICNECNQDLYVNKIEDENNERIYKIYREKANIIKAEDIVKLREKYDISQRELTAILGFGKMTINRYERGGLPTKSQSDYIKLLIENEDRFIEKVKEAYENNNITEKTYTKIVSEGHIRKYGQLRLNYLKNFDRGLYTELLIDGTLKQYLLDIDENANNKVNLLIKQFAESENINEQLKEHHQMEWVQAMNNIKNRAEEIVLNEIIYV